MPFEIRSAPVQNRLRVATLSLACVFAIAACGGKEEAAAPAAGAVPAAGIRRSRRDRSGGERSRRRASRTRAEPLAREVQRGMVRHMGLRDLGINYDNLAVLRPTWMPAILCEGAFVMLPEQEALLRMPEFQQAYALGVAEGLGEYFKKIGGR